VKPLIAAAAALVVAAAAAVAFVLTRHADAGPDPFAGVSYARFGPPWHRPKLLDRGTSGAELIDGGKNGGLGTYWYVAVDTGRPVPAIVTVTVPDNKNRLLPDINTVVRSLHVIR
jgi:hypothetical protein